MFQYVVVLVNTAADFGIPVVGMAAKRLVHAQDGKPELAGGSHQGRVR
jgi:hypothetical protein